MNTFLRFMAVVTLAVMLDKVERLVKSTERIADALKPISAAQTYQRSDVEEIEHRTRRHVTKQEEAFIMATPGCQWEAFVGYDNKIHPDNCRHNP